MYYYVYVVGWSPRGPSKIGVTDSVVSRLRELQTGNPFRLLVYHALRFDERGHAYEVERRTLKELKDHLLMGEWLKLAPNLVGKYAWSNAAEFGPSKWEPTRSDRKRRKENWRSLAAKRPALGLANGLTWELSEKRPLSPLHLNTD